MARAAVEDPIKAFRFHIEESGFKRAGFNQCNGLEATTEVAEYREGGNTETPQKSAGQTSYGNITLMRGQILGAQEGGDDDLVGWWQEVYQVSGLGNAANYRRDFDVVQFDAAFNEIRRWNVFNAWPVRFKPFSDLNAQGNDNSIEEIELANEGFQLAGV